ncbi:hypothetical protein BLOT_002902 [Blomia tropicalis]|nr:hypothetical protein BLOT_002902 [Blomia tropicalis]
MPTFSGIFLSTPSLAHFYRIEIYCYSLDNATIQAAYKADRIGKPNHYFSTLSSSMFITKTKTLKSTLKWSSSTMSSPHAQHAIYTDTQQRKEVVATFNSIEAEPTNQTCVLGEVALKS